MDFMLNIPILSPPVPISYRDPVMLTGSCFTEHIGNYLKEMKFDILQNPHGILFDPRSVARSIVSYIQPKIYKEEDLFYLNERWQSWQHHGFFSAIERKACIDKINESQARAHALLAKSKWLIVTLGSAFSYSLCEEAPDAVRVGLEPGDSSVSNCHRAPSQWFRKELMPIEEINAVLDNCIHQLFQFNPSIRIIFTVSPVRHIRDGVIENNRSKARLIEVVHTLANKFDRIYYFPAYELVVDVLRDYRFYDIDMVHPNYQATHFVLEKFGQHFMDKETKSLIQELEKIVIARKHRPFHTGTQAHRQFLQQQWEKAKEIQQRFPALNLEEELNYFLANKD